MRSKLTIRRCKNKSCEIKFQQLRPLQFVCSPKCAAEYQTLLKTNKEAKEWRNEKAVMKIDTHAKENKEALQRETNKLSRMIDVYFAFETCIDCGKTYGKQTDAAHFHSHGSNCSLRYNLHNLHSAASQCNLWSENHKVGYRHGLVKRYGGEYLIMVETLPLKYKEVHLSNFEIAEKLKIVRVLIRTFGTYKLLDSVSARNLFNMIIGIYK